MGINPFFEREQNIPYTSNQIPTMFASYGLRFFITPRYIYHINKRFYTDINLPIDFVNVDYQFVNYSNPTLPNSQQKYTVFDLDVLPKYISARIGIGINL